MAVAEILNEIARLPLHERIEIANHIYHSAEHLPAAADDSSAIALAKRRIDELQSGKATAVEHGEMMKRLKAEFA